MLKVARYLSPVSQREIGSSSIRLIRTRSKHESKGVDYLRCCPMSRGAVFLDLGIHCHVCGWFIPVGNSSSDAVPRQYPQCCWAGKDVVGMPHGADLNAGHRNPV